MTIHLTDMEKDVILSIANSEYSDEPGDPIWSWNIADNTKITKKEQVSGVVSSLVKKGLVGSDGQSEGNDSCTWLTKKGIEAYNLLKGD